MNYYIKLKIKKRNTAGAKAPEDINRICEKLGMQPINFPQFPDGKNKFFKKLWIIFIAIPYWINLALKVKKNDLIIYQHPMYANKLVAKFIPIIRKIKKCYFAVLIHDLESLRKGIHGVVNYNAKRHEYSDSVMLSAFDFIICHNDKMKSYLEGKDIDSSKLYILDAFDYICSDNKVARKKQLKPTIAIAGNLAKGKSGYVYSIKESDLLVNLYGINYDNSNSNKNTIYKGAYKPEELPMYLVGDFGLVWDGPVGDTCGGNTGEYLKYNNPHKTSLYLASNMPVIIWKEAAMADFIIKNKLGYAINNLDEVSDLINGINEKTYDDICNNVTSMGEKIRTGYFFSSVIERIVEKIDGEK